MDTLLTTELPNVLHLDSLSLVGPVSCKVQVEISESLERASEYNPKEDVLQHPPGTGDYFLNTSEYIGNKVTATRVNAYNKSLEGTALVDSDMTPEQFEEEYMSLHRVQYNQKLCNGKDEVGGGWQCDCKGFWHTRQCAHVYVVLAMLGKKDLAKSNLDLPRRNKVGRKTITKKAWQRQPPSPPAKRKKRQEGGNNRKGRKSTRPNKASVK